MSIIIVNNLSEDIDNSLIEIIKKSIIIASELEKCPFEFEISVTITDNKEIKNINNDFRGINKETDVLSFPLITYTSPSDFSNINEDDDDLFNLDTGELLLGDIVISYEKAKIQAEEYNHSIERELGFLTIHSMLHLFGYDHNNEVEEGLMISRQNQILEKVGLKR